MNISNVKIRADLWTRVCVWFLCWGVTWKPLHADDSSRYDLTSLAWIFPKDMQHWSSEDYSFTRKKKMKKKKEKEKEWSWRKELKQVWKGFLWSKFPSARGTFLKVIQEGWGSIFFHFLFNCIHGKLQKLNRKYEIWKFKKRHKTSPQWPQNDWYWETEDILLTFNCFKSLSFSWFSFFLLT